MIGIIMTREGARAHLRDRHVTWCGCPGDDEALIRKGTMICPSCWRSALADGAYTEEQLLEAQKLLGGRP